MNPLDFNKLTYKEQIKLIAYNSIRVQEEVELSASLASINSLGV